MHSFGHKTRGFQPVRLTTYIHYSFDIEVEFPTPAPVPLFSALVDSRSIPRIPSRLLIASRDPPIGTSIQKVGGSSTDTLD